MKEYLPILGKCTLFNDIKDSDYAAMLSCLGARRRDYGRDEAIFSEGDPANHVGIMLSGGAHIVKEDFYGNRSIVASIEPAQLFGETFACANIEKMPVSVISTKQSSILLIDCRRITRTCTNACSFHNRMILNLLRVVADKNLVFNQKIDIVSKRTTREKLMTYLLEQAKKNNSKEFTIPFDRQSLADYLGVERSALSAEIGKLRKEGVLESERSSFRLLE